MFITIIRIETHTYKPHMAGTILEVAAPILLIPPTITIPTKIAITIPMTQLAPSESPNVLRNASAV